MSTAFLHATAALTLGLAATSTPGGLLPGGSDDCQTPTPINGTGLFPFDSTTATTGTQGQNESLCLASGTNDISNDVWFAWTANVDGCATVNTCIMTTLDTRLAIYPGSSCPLDGTALACSDDACGYQSEVAFPVTAGETYMIQVGTFPGQAGGPGSLSINLSPCPAPVLNPSNGHYYMIMDGYMPWTMARDAAEATELFGVPGHLATLTDATENIFVYYQLTGNPLGVSWIGCYQDMNAPDYSEPSGGWRWVSGEPFVYTDWASGEPNDGGGAEHYGGYFQAEAWNDFTATNTTVLSWVVEWDTSTGTRYCFGDGSGTPCPCGNAGGPGAGCANSSGTGARLYAMGQPTSATDELLFRGENLTPGQSALLFVGLNATNNGDGLLFGDGLRCAGGSVVRLGVKIPDASGHALWGPGLAAQGGWGPGDVRRFQGWYRDPAGSACGSSFNLTNGVEHSFWP